MIFSKSLIGIVAIISGAFCMNENFIQPDNSKIQYFGRFDFSNPKEVAFDWPGVYIKGEFIGTECKVVLGGHSRYDVTIDEKSTVTVTVDSLKDTITIAEKLEKRNHSIVIVKRTESDSTPSYFYGFVLDNKAKMLNPSTPPKRKIEFIGDSYTAGFGNESTSRECSPDKCNELIFSSTNTSKAFGPLIASRFNAQYQVNAISGKGLVRNYNGIDKGRELLSYYDKVLLSSINNGATSTSWNFKSWHPDIIAIFIGINDFQADPPYSDSMQFDSKYISFVKFLQEQHPGVKIICCATKIWPVNSLIPRIKNIVDKLKKNENQDVFYFESVTENNALYGHPSLKDHQKIADELSPVIATITGWQDSKKH